MKNRPLGFRQLVTGSYSLPLMTYKSRAFAHLPSWMPKPQEEDSGPQPEQDAETLRSLLHFLLQASKRPSRSPAFLFQPQRFGRNSRGPWSHNRLSARTGVEHSSPFWSLIAPQRFGKK
ncbi:pro-FMRFamide-related neuropeptide FF isoform X1 [Suncus etruscus]|uniref:pro-FMRFamide-related neuropeptide FF isoform X1 n=1 Tax=Suncus etruscus TaxID=109475 RepID=UPI0021104E0D|nr:pro-FMRFamide-related neuropeptide FF isoform X1 [Suncus etruscus]